MKCENLVLSKMSNALSDFSNGFCNASIKMSIELEISGFLIVYPIKLSAYEAVFLMLG